VEFMRVNVKPMRAARVGLIFASAGLIVATPSMLICSAPAAVASILSIEGAAGDDAVAQILAGASAGNSI